MERSSKHLIAQWRHDADTPRKSMTLEELTRSLERRARDAEAMQSVAPVADVLRIVAAELGEVKPVQQSAQLEHRDRLLTVSELAARMNVADRYVYDHHTTWPFTHRVGRLLRFSEIGVEQWLRTKR